MVMEIHNFFESYLKQDSIFLDKAVLTSTYMPENIIYREEQIQEVANILAPALRVEKPSNVFIYGKTGTGKSTVFKNMIIQDMQNGFGVGVIDPHGELIDFVLENVPDGRVNDVVVFDPSDYKHPVGFNMLECSNPTQKNLMASGLLAAFAKHFGYSWGPRLEYLLNNGILTMLDVPGTTMLGITRLFADKNYQNYIVNKVKDPIIKEFWNKEFKDMKGNQSLITEALSPIQNKVGRFLSSSTIRNILGQRSSTIDLQDIMNNKKIFLINLSKGKIGEDNAYLLGSLLVSRMFFEIVQRVNMVPEERQPFYLYIDEFQNFSTDIFPSILSEARKYRLNLNLAHQYLYQLPESIKHAVFGNVGTVISFRVGSYDAKELAEEMKPVFTGEDLENLDNHHIALRLLIDGKMSPAFSAITMPPLKPKGHEAERETVLRISRERYATPRDIVEEKLQSWFENK